MAVMPGVDGVVDVLAGEAEEGEHDHAGDNVRATSYIGFLQLDGWFYGLYMAALPCHSLWVRVRTYGLSLRLFHQ